MSTAFGGPASFTVSPTEFITLSNCERFDDGSGYRATLDLAVDKFTCRGQVFHFEYFNRFVNQLRAAYHALDGVVELRCTHEPDKIGFKFTSLGHVVISGVSGEANGRGCTLQFVMEADQTFLAPFLDQLEGAAATLDGAAKTAEIFMPLVDEGTECWRPVTAKICDGFEFEILGIMPSDEAWQFAPGTRVFCRRQVFANGSNGLAALQVAGGGKEAGPPVRG